TVEQQLQLLQQDGSPAARVALSIASASQARVVQEGSYRNVARQVLGMPAVAPVQGSPGRSNELKAPVQVAASEEKSSGVSAHRTTEAEKNRGDSERNEKGASGETAGPVDSVSVRENDR